MDWDGWEGIWLRCRRRQKVGETLCWPCFYILTLGEAPVETATEDVPVSDAGAMPAKETATSTSDEKLQQTAGSGGGGGGKKKKKGKK